MGLVKNLKEMKTGGASGDLYVECDKCGNLVEANKGGVTGVSMQDKVNFTCKICKEVEDLRKELEDLKVKLAGEKVEVQREEVKIDKAVQCGVSEGVDTITQGMVLGDSMVRVLGNLVGKKKRDVVRCCLPGATVKKVGEVAKSAIKKGGAKVVIWAGTNDVGKATNEEFERDVTELLTEVKTKEVEVTVLGLLPRYGVQNGWINQRAKAMNKLLQAVCKREEVRFLDVWNASRRNWTGRDSLHLSWVGNREVAKLVLDSMEAKN